MALIKCPECGREGVSDSAISCPQCGFQISKNPPEIIIQSSEVSDNILKSMREKGIKIVRFFAVVFAIIAIISSHSWIKGRSKIKDINSQIESAERDFRTSAKKSATSTDYYYYENYIDSISEVNDLKEDKTKQKRTNTISLICFAASAVLLIGCFILL